MKFRAAYANWIHETTKEYKKELENYKVTQQVVLQIKVKAALIPQILQLTISIQARVSQSETY